MKKIALIFVLGCIIGSNNPLIAKSKWISLFNGKDLSGWFVRGNATWDVQDGILTGEGDLFCGDLLTNNDGPRKNSLIDDETEMDASIARLKDLNIRKIYPGHGSPFTLSELFQNKSE